LAEYENWDDGLIDKEYWDAQIEGFENEFKKPLWRDFLETQRELMDKVFIQAGLPLRPESASDSSRDSSD